MALMLKRFALVSADNFDHIHMDTAEYFICQILVAYRCNQKEAIWTFAVAIKFCTPIFVIIGPKVTLSYIVPYFLLH